VGETVVEEHPELRLAIGDHALPSECDAAIVQDAIVSFAHAARYPNAPQIFVAHSTLHDHQLPAQLPGICRLAVASTSVSRGGCAHLAATSKSCASGSRSTSMSSLRSFRW